MFVLTSWMNWWRTLLRVAPSGHHRFECAAMETGPLLGCSPARARTIVIEALNLCHRTPRHGVRSRH